MHYFPAKDDLIGAIIQPALERACARLDDLSKLGARRAAKRIVALYLTLYAEFPDAPRVSCQRQSGALRALGPAVQVLHGHFLASIVGVFDRRTELCRGSLRGLLLRDQGDYWQGRPFLRNVSGRSQAREIAGH